MRLRLFIVIFICQDILVRSRYQHSTIKPLGLQNGTCGKKFIGTLNGTIASPRFPHSNYTLDVSCKYEIFAGPGQVVAYQSLYMDLERRAEDACYDYVDIFQSGDINDESFDRYCGGEIVYPSVSSGSKLTVMFVSDVSISHGGFVIAWWILSPRTMQLSVNCNFDDPIPLCPGWTQSPDDSFNWTFLRGPTPSPRTGPLFDHTTGRMDGRYAYIEASGIDHGHTAALKSPLIQSDRHRCLNFWYHNHGHGQLDVIVLANNAGGTVEASYVNNTGPEWIKASLSLRNYNRTIQVVFEAIRGTSYRSDVAIDDVTVVDGRCPSEHVCGENQFACENPFPDFFEEGSDYETEISCVRKEFVCDGSDDCFDGSDEANCSITVRCPFNQIYQTCASACNRTCADGLQVPTCSSVCTPRCACPFHLPYLHDGTCIKYRDCPDAAQSKLDSQRQRANNQITSGFQNLLSLFAKWIQDSSGA